MRLWSLCKDGLTPVEATLRGRKLLKVFCAYVRHCGLPKPFVTYDYNNFLPGRHKVLTVGLEFHSWYWAEKLQKRVRLFRCSFSTILYHAKAA